MIGRALRGGWFLLLVSSSAASAYVVGAAKWDASAFPIPYWIDPRMATTTEGVISPEVVRQAFARWSDLPSSSFAAAQNW